jgi:hypothetical protein
MKNLHTPPFLNNLYRDLRDRRLLLPAAALLVALVVVPVALSDSPTTTTAPPPAAASGSQKPTPTEPAVLAEQLGVTNYQKRLEQLQSKNPFERQYVDAPADTGSAASTAADATASTSTSATTAGSSVSTSPAPPTSAPSTSSAPSEPSEPSEPALFVFQADVSIGIPGDLSRRKHVKLGSFLPSEGKSMVAFIGATQDLKHALFVVSDDVSSVDTDGRCVPGENNCKLLRLKVGDEAKLLYAPEGDRTYKLRLEGIDLVEFDTDASAKHGKRGSAFDAELAVAGQG